MQRKKNRTNKKNGAKQKKTSEISTNHVESVAHINARAQSGFSLDNRDTRTTHDDDNNDANNGKW